VGFMNPPAAWPARQTAVHRFSARGAGGSPEVDAGFMNPSAAWLARQIALSARGAGGSPEVDVGFMNPPAASCTANGGPSVLSPRMRAVAGSHGREPMVREPTHPPSRECGGSREQPTVGSYEIQSAEQCGLGQPPLFRSPYCSAMEPVISLPRVTSRLRRFLTRGYTLSPSSRAFRGLFEGLCLTIGVDRLPGPFRRVIFSVRRCQRCEPAERAVLRRLTWVS
jgi:hypothetical protein